MRAFFNDPTVRSAVVSGVVAFAIWFASDRASKRAKAATDALENRRIDNEGRVVDLSVLTQSVETLQGRLDDVEEDLKHEKEQRKLANTYARTLAQVLRDEGLTVPPPPAGLDFP